MARLSGKVFEAVSALVQRRPPCDLCHAALEVALPGRRLVIEMTGASDLHGCERGVVCQGAMFAHWLGRFRLFRYEVRRWPDDTIPDAKWAVESPVLLSTDVEKASRLLELAAAIPRLCGEHRAGQPAWLSPCDPSRTPKITGDVRSRQWPGPVPADVACGRPGPVPAPHP